MCEQLVFLFVKALSVMKSEMVIFHTNSPHQIHLVQFEYKAALVENYNGAYETNGQVFCGTRQIRNCRWRKINFVQKQLKKSSLSSFAT